jgi:hypothetical protein
VLLRLHPPNAPKASATTVAPMARKAEYGMTRVAPVDPGRLSM